MSYQITQNFITGLPQDNYRNGKGNYEGVVAHSTASPEATDEAERNYEAGHWKDAFVHFFVDNDSITQVANTDYKAWGAGPTANARYVHVELCEFADATKFKESYSRYVWLLAKILFNRKLGVKRLGTFWTHHDVTTHLGGTTHTDPDNYLSSHGVSIDKLVADITAEYNKMAAPAPAPAPTHMYRVRKSWADASSQIGAFSDLDNAKALADQHKSEGFEVFDENGKMVYDPTPAPAPVQHMYRVRKTWADAASQIGAFTDLDNARSLADQHPGYVVFDETGKALYSKVVEAPAPKPAPAPAPKPVPQPAPAPTPAPAPVENHDGHHAIMGKSVAVAEQMAAFVKAVNPSFDEAIAAAYLKVGEKYGIRGDVAFSQSIIETGYFKFDGGTAVTPDQHNYCGMGVTSKGMKGNSFSTIEDGVTAQMQHLLAYASKNAIPTGDKVLDPRFQYVTRGIAPHWEDLNNRWAMNSNYGQSILAVYAKVMATPVPKPAPVPVEQPKPTPTPVPEPTPAPVEEKPEVPAVPVETPQPEPQPEAPVEAAPAPVEEKVNIGLLNRVLQAILDFFTNMFKKN